MPAVSKGHLFKSVCMEWDSVEFTPHENDDFVHQVLPNPPGFSGGRGCSLSS